jgi:Ran GTPase-activating protein (RanGAP) involved in mRNA processing and transport
LVLEQYDDRRANETGELINAVLDDVSSYESAKETALSVAGAGNALDEIGALVRYVPQDTLSVAFGESDQSGGPLATASSAVAKMDLVAPPTTALEYVVYAQVRASEASIVLYRLVKHVASEVNASLVVLPGGVKKLARTVFKTAVKYNCDLSKVTDLVRCTVVAGSLAEVAEVFHAFLSCTFTTVLQVKNRFAPDYATTLVGGYLDLQLKVRFNSGGSTAIGEVQINLWSVLRIKEAHRGGHAVFNFVRSLRAYDPAMYTYHGQPDAKVCSRISSGEIMVAHFSGARESNSSRRTAMLVAQSLRSKNCRLVLLDQSHCSLTIAAIKLLTVALQTKFCSLTTLKLNDNFLGKDGGKALGEAFAFNTSLKVVDVERTDLGNEGVAALATGLKQNDTLMFVHLGDVTAQASTLAIVAEAVERRPGRKVFCPDLDIWRLGNGFYTGETVNLSNVSLGSTRIETLAGMVAASTTLLAIVVSGCDLGDGGVETLLRALRSNISVTTVDLSNNNMSDSGARDLATTLEKSTTLRTISLRGNEFDVVGVVALAHAFAKRPGLDLQIDQSKVLLALSDSSVSALDKKLIEALNTKTTSAQKWAEATGADPQKGVHLSFQRGDGTRRREYTVFITTLPVGIQFEPDAEPFGVVKWVNVARRSYQAQELGVRVGDRLSHINGVEVCTFEEAREQMLQHTPADIPWVTFDTYLVKGVDAGSAAWYYTAVNELKLHGFLTALNDDIIHLENWGNIAMSAYGDEPSASATERLEGDLMKGVAEEVVTAIETDVDALEVVKRALRLGAEVNSIMVETAARFGRANILEHLLRCNAYMSCGKYASVNVSWTDGPGEQKVAGANGWAKWSNMRNCTATISDPLAATSPLKTVSGGILVVQHTPQDAGGSHFSEIAYRAQQAGAEGVLIVNYERDDEPAAMAPGNNAAEVMIPVALLSSTQGVQLIEAMRTGAKPLISFTGTGCISERISQWPVNAPYMAG